MIDYGFEVQLGALDQAHNDEIRRWRNDQRIWSWCRQNNLISDLDQAKWFERQNNDPSIRMFSIISHKSRYLVEPRIIGVCGFTSIDLISRRAEFSLYIAPEFQGCGYGRAALKTLFTYGFKEMGLHNIWGESFEGNHAQELFKSLGMTVEGVRRDFYFKSGKFLDATLFSLLEPEWRKLEWISQVA